MKILPHILGLVCVLTIISAMPAENSGKLRDLLENMYRAGRPNSKPGLTDEVSSLFATALRNFRHSLDQILEVPAPSPPSGGNGTGTPAPYYNSMQHRISDGVNLIIKGAFEGDLKEILHGSLNIPENDKFRAVAGRIVDAVFANNGTR